MTKATLSLGGWRAARRCLVLVTWAVSTVWATRPALAQAGAISGIVFADANGNGQRDPGENGMANVPLKFSGLGATVSGVSNVDGGYFFTAEVGAWTVTVTPPAGFEVVGGAARAANIAAAQQNIVLDFGLRPVQVGPTNTFTPPLPTLTPGILPTTGAPISGRGLTLLALLGAFVLGAGLLISAWKSRPG